MFADPAHIADSAFLRREIAQRMGERLDLIKLTPDSVLDAGCGTGDDLLMLHQRYPQARLYGTDLSRSMLDASNARLHAAQPFFKRLFSQMIFRRKPVAQLQCGNFANLEWIDSSIGLLWSNLALHWHPHPEQALAEWRRVLQTEGLLMFTCFGPDTLKELRQAFAAADNYPHTPAFTDMHDLGDMLLQAGFATPVMDMEQLTITYDTPDKLLTDVRALGGNPLTERRRGLLGRQAHQRFIQALESQRQADGKIPLTFEILYGHAFKPATARLDTNEVPIRFSPRNSSH